MDQQTSNPSSDVVVQSITTGLNAGTSQQILYNQKAAITLGGAQILIGIVNVVLNITYFDQLFLLSLLHYGFWGGSVFIIAGITQIISGSIAQNNRLIMGTLVTCVLAACACPFGLSFGIQDARGDFFKPLYKSLASVVAVLAFVEAAISIVSSVMCCNAICRIKPAMTPISVQTAGNQTVTYQANNPATFPPGLLTAPSYPGFNRASKPIQYNRKAAKGLGSIQMTIGIICILINIILLAVNSEPNYFTQISQIGYGIWGGIVFLIAGYLQVLSGRKIQNKHLPTQPYELVHIAKTHIALGSFMAILAFVEAVISITGASLCCGTVCWNSSDMADVPIHAAGNQTVMYQANNPVVFPLGPSPEKPSAQQVEYHPSPQIPMNSGLISNHPPPYS